MTDEVLEAYLKRRLYKPSEQSRLTKREQIIPTVLFRSDTSAGGDALPTSSSSYTIGAGTPVNWILRTGYPHGTWGRLNLDSNLALFTVPWDGLYSMYASIDYEDRFTGGTGTISTTFNPVMGSFVFNRTDRYYGTGQSDYLFNLQGFCSAYCKADEQLLLNLFISSVANTGAQGAHQVGRFYWFIDYHG